MLLTGPFGLFFTFTIKIYKYVCTFLYTMEIGEKISFVRKTFRYGNSVGIVVPAQMRVAPGVVLKVVIERIDPTAKP